MWKVNNISIDYKKKGSSVRAIRQANFEINRGDFVSIIGPSGSGKSSLLLMLGGMLSPSSGELWYGDQCVYALSAAKRAKLRRDCIGFVFQTFNLVPYLTALQNVQLPLLLQGCEASQQHKRAEELLRRVGLGDRLHHTPAELSIGQQQRVAMARTVANDPEIILADEPTGSLDPEMREQIIDFLVELNNEGRTVVMVTHDMELARRGSRSFTIDAGVLTENICADVTAAPTSVISKLA